MSEIAQYVFNQTITTKRLLHTLADPLKNSELTVTIDGVTETFKFDHTNNPKQDKTINRRALQLSYGEHQLGDHKYHFVLEGFVCNDLDELNATLLAYKIELNGFKPIDGFDYEVILTY